MSEFITFEESIFLNQVAQGVYPMEELTKWFEPMSEDRQILALKEVAHMIQQAKILPEDGDSAVKESGLKPTFTPCILLGKGANSVQVNRIVMLPKAERTKSLILLMYLFRVADRRRRAQEPYDEERHWWHRDLSKPEIVEEVRLLHRNRQI